jgi:tetratricopeptide (TPR) repeat protein
MDYSKVCFVIMPFGTKKVGRKKVNFDEIYDNIFMPAINATKLPEGGNLIARRTDKDFFTGNISLEMFHYIEYSRFALADISGLNANVFYELGVRHRAHQAGTAIFKQLSAPIPFDINQIKAFPYEYEPQENIAKSQQLITRVLEESLVQNKIDSPVRQALMIQQAQTSNIEAILHEAENAIRKRNVPAAIAKFKEAIAVERDDPKLYLKLGLLYKEQEKWQEALDALTKATNLADDYSDAFREKGIVENQVCRKANWSPDLTTGEESLRKAVELNPEDYDAYASLGGVLKRQKRLEEALDMYKRATEVSRGNPYPLLNELKIYLLINQTPSIENKYKFYLKRAERILCAQVENKEPLDTPWSFFNLSEVCLYLGDKEGFLKYLDEGIFCAAKWQIETHREALELLQGSKLTLPGLDEGIDKLREAEELMSD